MCQEEAVLGKLSYDDGFPWVSPTFTQPKKTGDIRILTNFRKMNLAIERKLFPLPWIGETIQMLEHFLSAVVLDRLQGYYSTSPSVVVEEVKISAQPFFPEVYMPTRGSQWELHVCQTCSNQSWWTYQVTYIGPFNYCTLMISLLSNKWGKQRKTICSTLELCSKDSKT